MLCTALARRARDTLGADGISCEGMIMHPHSSNIEPGVFYSSEHRRIMAQSLASAILRASSWTGRCWYLEGPLPSRAAPRGPSDF